MRQQCKYETRFQAELKVCCLVALFCSLKVGWYSSFSESFSWMTDPMCIRFSVLQSVMSICVAHLACCLVGFESCSHGREGDILPSYSASIIVHGVISPPLCMHSRDDALLSTWALLFSLYCCCYIFMPVTLSWAR